MALALLQLSEVNHSFPPCQRITVEVPYPSQNSHFLACPGDRYTWQAYSDKTVFALFRQVPARCGMAPSFHFLFFPTGSVRSTRPKTFSSFSV